MLTSVYRLGDNVPAITLGSLYAVHAILPCATGLPPILNSDGIGMNGGYAEYVVVDQRQLVPVVRIPASPCEL